MRYARITLGGSDSVETVAKYLPGNYSVIATDTGDFEGDRVAIIAGEDSHGWTLDDYVLPRLASGLMFGREVAHASDRS